MSKWIFCRVSTARSRVFLALISGFPSATVEYIMMFSAMVMLGKSEKS